MKNLIIVLAATILISCGTSSDSFETTKGTLVNYIENGDGDVSADSLVGLFCISYETESGSSLYKGDPDNPQPLKIDPTSAAQQGELYEILSKLRTGDSVGFELVAADLFRETFRAPLPDSIPADSKIRFQISFIDQLTETGYYAWAEEKTRALAEKQIIVDREILDEFMARNNVDAQTTESGLRYVVTEEGNGAKPQSGQSVQVNYAGWVLDGEYFDTSIESVAREQGLYQEGRPYQPFSFTLGQGQVIKGWDEGIALLNVGSKARLYIPSTLGYGSRGSGRIIKPNSILVFDVELVDIQ